MKLLHAADLHLDSAFAGLSDREAALCREESRTRPERRPPLDAACPAFSTKPNSSSRPSS